MKDIMEQIENAYGRSLNLQKTKGIVLMEKRQSQPNFKGSDQELFFESSLTQLSYATGLLKQALDAFNDIQDNQIFS